MQKTDSVNCLSKRFTRLKNWKERKNTENNFQY